MSMQMGISTVNIAGYLLSILKTRIQRFIGNIRPVSLPRLILLEQNFPILTSLQMNLYGVMSS